MDGLITLLSRLNGTAAPLGMASVSGAEAPAAGGANCEPSSSLADARITRLSEQVEQLHKQSLQIRLTQYGRLAQLGDAIVSGQDMQQPGQQTEAQQMRLNEYQRLAALRDAIVIGLGTELEQQQKQLLQLILKEYSSIRDTTTVSLELMLVQQQLNLQKQEAESARFAEMEEKLNRHGEANFMRMTPAPTRPNFTDVPLAATYPMVSHMQLMQSQATLANSIAVCQQAQKSAMMALGPIKKRRKITCGQLKTVTADPEARPQLKCCEVVASARVFFAVIPASHRHP